jgi:hypothetical protein
MGLLSFSGDCHGNVRDVHRMFPHSGLCREGDSSLQNHGTLGIDAGSGLTTGAAAVFGAVTAIAGSISWAVSSPACTLSGTIASFSSFCHQGKSIRHFRYLQAERSTAVSGCTEFLSRVLVCRDCLRGRKCPGTADHCAKQKAQHGNAYHRWFLHVDLLIYNGEKFFAAQSPAYVYNAKEMPYLKQYISDICAYCFMDKSTCGFFPRQSCRGKKHGTGGMWQAI